MDRGRSGCARLHTWFPLPQEFLQSVQEQNACLSPGASLPPEFQQLKAQYVVSTIAFTKWKTFFPKLFPMGFVASDGVHSEETQTSFQLGWLIFLIAKTTLLANKGCPPHPSPLSLALPSLQPGRSHLPWLISPWTALSMRPASV